MALAYSRGQDRRLRAPSIKSEQSLCHMHCVNSIIHNRIKGDFFFRNKGIWGHAVVCTDLTFIIIKEQRAVKTVSPTTLEKQFGFVHQKKVCITNPQLMIIFIQDLILFWLMGQINNCVLLKEKSETSPESQISSSNSPKPKYYSGLPIIQ